LKPGVDSGTTDINVIVNDEFPLHFTPTVNNLGTKNTGYERYGFGLAHNNLLGRMDQLSVRYQMGDGAWAVGTDYNIPINSYGTRAGVSYARAEVDLEGDFADLQVEGEADVYSAYLLHPLFRRDWLEAHALLGFESKSIENRQLGITTGDDELRMLKVGFNLEETDRYGKTFFPNLFNVGFDSILGASDKVDAGATRTGTGGQFFSYRGSAIRYQRLPWDVLLNLRGHVQISPDELPPSEQLRLGGAHSVRGYQEGEYLADYGGHATAELWIPTFFIPRDWRLPFSDKPIRKQIQMIGFFDYGGGKLHTPLAGEDKSRYFAGAGAGLRIHLFDRLYARVEWGSHVGASTPNDNRDSEFYFGVSMDALKGLVK